jgi:hypothetical protein
MNVKLTLLLKILRGPCIKKRIGFEYHNFLVTHDSPVSCI